MPLPFLSCFTPSAYCDHCQRQLATKGQKKLLVHYCAACDNRLCPTCAVDCAICYRSICTRHPDENHHEKCAGSSTKGACNRWVCASCASSRTCSNCKRVSCTRCTMIYECSSCSKLLCVECSPDPSSCFLCGRVTCPACSSRTASGPTRKLSNCRCRAGVGGLVWFKQDSSDSEDALHSSSRIS